jgi:hypothetical protein
MSKSKTKTRLFTTDSVDDEMYMSSDLHVERSIKGSNALELVHERQNGHDEHIILYRDGVKKLKDFFEKWLKETE